ncbi:lytic murein transglycosylase B [Chitinimonas sp. BJB300]|uniref:lytic murein transglycosylase B n=1 Tax=Chitinimonas sp. BJB300 TaxID=1559339 RepID=UPI000C0EB2D9|nr:lytic murein transglycosylase B [Chitinimonas sp. BJB300]PHV10431.1 lytic murein transglycosylase B [Chitinimonas sp. BJB300]TSJ83270.1 lytic murein transglycosylase B [Chitinimonas sp. BJB300]
MPLRTTLLSLVALSCLAADPPALPLSAANAENPVRPLLGGQATTDVANFAYRPDVQAFINEMVQKYGFNAQSLTDLFTQVQFKPNILTIFDRPSTSRPYYQFRPDFVNNTRIRLGVAFWQDHAGLLQAVSEKYGIEPEYLVSILGVETLWGRNTGSFRVMDALATTAFGYPRRADFFRTELREFLLLTREEGVDPFSFRGSYAGAMGMPQFMPSSFHKFAQDWDGDGHHDIHGNVGDILASVANYFRAHGWVKGQGLVVPANVEGEAYSPLVEDKFNLHYKVSELTAFGVVPARRLEGDPLAVLVPLESEPGMTRYWLGLGNFYAITRYNRSTLYAMATHELAQAIKAAWLDPSLLPPPPKPVTKKSKAKGKARPAIRKSHKKR